jgi:flagellar biosynthesis/type III secretory pathway M-ring protein FliF/YscJ
VLGVTPERGDQLVIESLPFEQTRALDDNGGVAKPPGTAPAATKLLQDRRVWMGGGAALLVVAVLVFVLRSRKAKTTVAEAPAALPAGRSAKGDGPGRVGAAAHEPAAQVAEMNPVKSYLPPITGKAQGLLAQIQETVVRDPEFAANIVRGWMEED